MVYGIPEFRLPKAIVAKEVSMLSVRALSSHLNMDSEEYNVLVSDIASSLNAHSSLSADEKRELVKADLSDAFVDYGVEVEGTALDNIVDDVIAEFDGRDDVSEDEVSKYLAQHVIEETANDDEFEFDNEIDY